MKALIVFCHPEPQSFSATLKDIATRRLSEQGYEVEVTDLYGEGFNPVESPAHYSERVQPNRFYALDEQRYAFENGVLPGEVEREIDRLQKADLIIFQFPLWWHAPPAMLKGWFDRIFVYGGLYSGSVRYNHGSLTGKRALCSVTTGAPESTFSLHGRSGYMPHLLWPVHRSLYYLGLSVLPPQVFYGVQGGGIQYQAQAEFESKMSAHQQAWSDRLARLEEDAPLPFTGWEDWEADGAVASDHPHRWSL